MTSINQTLTIFGALLGLLSAAATSVANLLWKENRQAVWAVLAGLLPICSLLTTALLLRHYRVRMQQTDAERALCRLRRYFVVLYPKAAGYVTGRVTDDWPTPYTHRWRSMTYFGWLALILVAASFAAASMVSILFAFSIGRQPQMIFYVSAATGTLYGLALAVWLNRKLTLRQQHNKPRFTSASAME